MHTFLQPLTIVLLFVLVRAGDVAITSGQAHDVVRALCYGVVAILALIVLVLSVA